MPYPFIALISIMIFALVHLGAEKVRKRNIIRHSTLLSIGGGVAIAYVFIDLLPKLCKSDIVVQKIVADFLPFLERNAYMIALAGFLLFYIVAERSAQVRKKRIIWLPLSSYALFNFLVGYAVVNKNDPEIQPLALFTIALALHYFTNDYTLSKDLGNFYHRIGRWILIVCLFLGWLLGIWVILAPAAVALIGAFIGGGVIMNIIRHELPTNTPHNLGAFLLSAILYTCILLMVGAHGT